MANIEIAEKEFAAYITNEIIINAAINQKTNTYKTFHRFYCNQYITYSLISLSLLLIPYAIDFGIVKLHQKIKIENSTQANHNINKILN